MTGFADWGSSITRVSSETVPMNLSDSAAWNKKLPDSFCHRNDKLENARVSAVTHSTSLGRGGEGERDVIHGQGKVAVRLVVMYK